MHKHCTCEGWGYLPNEWKYLLGSGWFDFLWYSFVRKMFLKKCRWHFDFVLTKVEEFSFSQGPNGEAACRDGKQKDQMEQANYWTQGEEPGCRRGSNNMGPRKRVRMEKRGSWWAKAKEGPGRPRRSVANRIIAFLLLAGWLSHCSPGLRKATCRQNTTAALFVTQTEKLPKRGHFCTRWVRVPGRFHRHARKITPWAGQKRMKSINCIAWGEKPNIQLSRKCTCTVDNVILTGGRARERKRVGKKLHLVFDGGLLWGAEL